MEQITLTSLLLRGAAVAILLAANAFFVAAEFALDRRIILERIPTLEQPPTAQGKLIMGLPSISLTSLNLLGVAALGADGLISQALTLAYVPQWIETAWGTYRPAIGYKPSWIGVRQLSVSTLYTLLFVWTW